MSNYDQDIAIIEAATDGPWGFDEFSNVLGVNCQEIVDEFMRIEDAEYIAHFNPAYVLELVEIKRLAVVAVLSRRGEARAVALQQLEELLK